MRSTVLNILGIGSARVNGEGGSVSPSQLGVQAANEAILRAGLSPADVSLLVGDCSTPVEKTPSEAQRIGKLLDIKVPAFDIPSGTSAFVQHLDVLNSWKLDRVPKVVLSVSTNTAHHEGSHGQPLHFGNGAGAAVLSTTLPGKLRVIDSFCTTRPEFASAFSVATFGGISIDPHFLSDTYPRFLDELLGKALKNNQLDGSKVCLVASVASQEGLDRIADSYRVPSEGRWYKDLFPHGDFLGATSLITLANRWNNITPDTTIVVVTAGMGMTYGYGVLRGN